MSEDFWKAAIATSAGVLIAFIGAWAKSRVAAARAPSATAPRPAPSMPPVTTGAPVVDPATIAAMRSEIESLGRQVRGSLRRLGLLEGAVQKLAALEGRVGHLERDLVRHEERLMRLERDVNDHHAEIQRDLGELSGAIQTAMREIRDA